MITCTSLCLRSKRSHSRSTFIRLEMNWIPKSSIPIVSRRSIQNTIRTKLKMSNIVRLKTITLVIVSFLIRRMLFLTRGAITYFRKKTIILWVYANSQSRNQNLNISLLIKINPSRLIKKIKKVTQNSQMQYHQHKNNFWKIVQSKRVKRTLKQAIILISFKIKWVNSNWFRFWPKESSNLSKDYKWND